MSVISNEHYNKTRQFYLKEALITFIFLKGRSIDSLNKNEIIIQIRYQYYTQTEEQKINWQ